MSPFMSRWMLMLALSTGLLPMSLQAQEPSCQTRALEKKLAGAAKTSFLKKCEKDAAAACDLAATQKKLAGAARTSFTGKCVRDAVGQAQVH